MNYEERAKINTLNEVYVSGDRQEVGQFLLYAYQKILKNDDSFYFLDEIDALLIRYSPSVEDEMKEYADTCNNLGFNFVGLWRENNPLVIKYSDYFVRMLHNNSVFVLDHYHEFNGADGERMLERVFHLSYNVFKYTGLYQFPEYALYSLFAQGRISMHYSDRRNGR